MWNIKQYLDNGRASVTTCFEQFLSVWLLWWRSV